MDATEFCALTPDSIARMLSGRRKTARDSGWHGRRSAPRWPFPSTVELWLPMPGGGEQHCLATSVNLSTTGIGLKTDEPLAPGTRVGIAIHEPEMSFHGRAIVRHCAETEHGFSIVGLEFLFSRHNGNR